MRVLRQAFFELIRGVEFRAIREVKDDDGTVHAEMSTGDKSWDGEFAFTRRSHRTFDELVRNHERGNDTWMRVIHGQPTLPDPELLKHPNWGRFG